MPSLNACCRTAPTVRFMALETLATAVLLFECTFRSRRSVFDQGFLAARFLFLTMSMSSVIRRRQYAQITNAAQYCDNLAAPQSRRRPIRPVWRMCERSARTCELQTLTFAAPF